MPSPWNKEKMAPTPDQEPKNQRADLNEHTLRVQQLFIQHQARLRSFLLSIAPDFSTTDDALQETFIVISRKADQFTPGSNFQAWARRIAIFTLLSHVRDRQRGPMLLADDVIETLVACAPFDDDSTRHNHKLELLKDCIGKLAPAARELIRLRYFNEHLPEEIARLRSQSVNAINVTLARARVTLRKCIENKLAADPLSP